MAQANDSVQFISKHITPVGGKDRNKLILNCLREYHTEGTSETRKQELRDIIVLQTWHLFPYILGQRKFQYNIFEECLQNMVLAILKAIENFNTELTTVFSAYIAGYLQEAISESLKSVYIVTIPANIRQQQLEQMEEEERQRLLCSAEQTEDAFENAYSCADHAYHDDADRQMCFVGPEQQCSTELTKDFKRLVNVFWEDLDYATVSDYVNTVPMESEIHRREIYSCLEQILQCPGNGKGETEFDILFHKEKAVITYRYGIFGAPKLTLDQVVEMFRGAGWGGKKSWVFQIETNAKRKLRIFFEERGIDIENLF